jgi:O-antigen/teichoic acid export membrane protein
VAWLLAAVPLAALASVASAVLRGSQRVGRLATAQTVAAVVGVGVCGLLVRPGDPGLVVFVPLTIVAAVSIATAVAAWPVCRPWLSAGGAWFAGGVARAVAAYGVANLVMGVATAGALLAIGRHYLAVGDLETAGRIAALAWLGEPLAAAFVAGHHATTYPAYAVAQGPAAAAVLARAVRGVVLVAAPVLLLASWAAPALVDLVFSAAFRDITGLIALQALATYLRSSNIVLGLPLLARGRLGALTVLHVGWALALAIGALAWVGPSMPGAAAFVQASAVAAGSHFVIQFMLLRAYGLAPAWRDFTWLIAGAAPLVWMALGP